MTATGVLVGLDVGTTRLKAVVVDLDGDEVATAAVLTPWIVNGAAVEMDPRALVSLAVDVVVAALADAALADDGHRRVLGLGVTGMGEAGVLLDRAGEPVGPIVAWYDERGDVEGVARALPELPVRTGIPFNPLGTIFKLADRTDDLRRRRWLNVPEWVVHSFGGEQFAEISLAGRTGMHDLHTGQWWPAALELLGVDETLFPGEARPGTEGAGRATLPAIAGAQLVVAGHDHQVAAFAVGATEPGCLFESLGTADALTLAVSPPVAEATIADITATGATIGRTVVADRLLLSSGLRTGQLLERIGRLLDVPPGPARHDLSARAALLDGDPGLTVTLADGELSITGIGEAAGPEALWRAAVEATDVHRGALASAFQRWFGVAHTVVLGGGWLGDPTIAAVTRRRFPGATRTRFAEPGAVGAAAMSGIAAGVLHGPFATRTPEGSVR